MIFIILQADTKALKKISVVEAAEERGMIRNKKVIIFPFMYNSKTLFIILSLISAATMLIMVMYS